MLRTDHHIGAMPCLSHGKFGVTSLGDLTEGDFGPSGLPLPPLLPLTHLLYPLPGRAP